MYLTSVSSLSFLLWKEGYGPPQGSKPLE